MFGGTAKYLQELGAGGEVGFGVMRPTWFMDNWAEQGSLQKTVRAEGRAYSASGAGRIPWVSKTDIAACAYAALTAEAPPNGDYVILGPELLSYGEVGAMIAPCLPGLSSRVEEARETNWVTVCGHPQRRHRQEGCSRQPQRGGVG